MCNLFTPLKGIIVIRDSQKIIYLLIKLLKCISHLYVQHETDDYRLSDTYWLLHAKITYRIYPSLLYHVSWEGKGVNKRTKVVAVIIRM